MCALAATSCRKPARPAPPYPPNPRATGRTVTVNWTASTTAGVDYYVYRASAPCATASSFTKLNTAVITTTSYTDSNVPVGTYCYYATSHLTSADPNESTPSNKAEVVIQSQPAPPSNLTVEPVAVTVLTGGTQQFTAARGSEPAAVEWSINPQEGSISSTGLYTAPSSVKGNNIPVEVVARDANGSASAAITLRKN